MLKVDLHNHTNYVQNRETNFGPKEIIDKAASQDVDVLCLSEHFFHIKSHFKEYKKDPLKSYRDFKDYANKKGILLLPGTEVRYKEGEALLINFNDDLNKYPGITDLSKLPDDVLVVAPHPFFKKNICLGKNLFKFMHLFDAIEYSFFYTRRFNLNKKAVDVAASFKKPMLGSSDCHDLSNFGYTYSLVNAKKDPKSVVNAIRKGDVVVVTRPLPRRLFYSSIYNTGFKILPRRIISHFKSRS